jgi:transposase InsO family protein
MSRLLLDGRYHRRNHPPYPIRCYPEIRPIMQPLAVISRLIPRRQRIHHAYYETRAQARADIFFYIEAFYNRRRRHSTVGYVSPAAFEEAYYSNASIILK